MTLPGGYPERAGPDAARNAAGALQDMTRTVAANDAEFVRLRRLAVDEDNGDQFSYTRHAIALDEFYVARPLHPEAALVAALLWFPRYIHLVADHLAPVFFTDRQCQAMYTALLKTPYTGQRAAAWWHAVAHTLEVLRLAHRGNGRDAVLAMSNYETWNICYLPDYARAILAQYSARECVKWGELLLNVRGDTTKLARVIAELEDLRALTEHEFERVNSKPIIKTPGKTRQLRQIAPIC